MILSTTSEKKYQIYQHQKTTAELNNNELTDLLKAPFKWDSDKTEVKYFYYV